jgi:hypothetical protein
VKWEDEVAEIPVSPLSALAGQVGAGATLEALAASRDAELTVVMPHRLRDGIERFLASHRVEAGGLMLGRLHRIAADAPPSIVAVLDFVPGRVFEGTGVSLALGTEVWGDARPMLDAGQSVVGWAHSHPDLGAFFSGTDRRTQRAFFAQPWQLGLCVDPVRREEAWFRGADSCDEGIRIVYA